jgi:hypothetical protein
MTFETPSMSSCPRTCLTEGSAPEAGAAFTAQAAAAGPAANACGG